MYRPTRWHRCCQFRRGDHPISCISKRAKTVEIKYRLPSHGPVAHLVIDATGLKVYGEGEWKIRKLDTLVLYLQQIGVSRFEVDASSFMLALRQR